jgi:hypothetical protein
MSRLAVVFLFVGAALLAVGGLHVIKSSDGSALPIDRHDDFAQDRQPTPAESIPFDGARAMTYLEEICKIGPRISGTEGMKRQQELVQKHFEACGGKVSYQAFTAKQKSRRNPVDMANMVISWFPERKNRILISSHYDTRPIADQEPDRRNWQQPFISANDGGSGVVLLMELANHMKALKTGVGVDFVLFDGEEYIFDSEVDKYFFGSEHFAREYRRRGDQGHYTAGVLLDMIGGKDATFPVEPNSWFKAEAVVRELWGVAAEIRVPAFQFRDGGTAVQDDHISLNGVGIPTVDIIDFKYPHWHRLTDLPSNCSGESITQVARVLIAWLQRQK